MKPILFNTEMVQALLAGRKTVTRRVVKPQPAYDLIYKEDGKYFYSDFKTRSKMTPPCHPGDILYVRETWAIHCCDDWILLEARDAIPECKRTETDAGCYVYRADRRSGGVTPCNTWPAPHAWRPSIHMPKEAARIFLRVTGVRVERLRKMEIADFKAEGILPRRPKGLPGHGCDCVWKHDRCLESPCSNRDTYEYLCWMDTFWKVWDSTLKPADRALYGWAANPWVWVIEFEQISGEEAAAYDSQ